MNAELMIVGAGPAGIAAAIQAHRLGLDVVVIERDRPGGQVRTANLVENYPGFPGGITGAELADRFAAHLAKEGVRVLKQHVSLIRPAKGWLDVLAGGEAHSALSVIAATGAEPRPWDVRVPAALERYVHTEVWDANMFKGKTVVVIGGGEAALDRALRLAGAGASPTIVSRSGVRAMELLVGRARERGIPIRTGESVQAVETAPEGGLLLKTSGPRPIRADHVVVAIGKTPRLDILAPGLVDDPMADPTGLVMGALPGLYIAGDAVAGDRRQTAVAVGAGVAAAIEAHRHVRKVKMPQ